MNYHPLPTEIDADEFVLWSLDAQAALLAVQPHGVNSGQLIRRAIIDDLARHRDAVIRALSLGCAPRDPVVGTVALDDVGDCQRLVTPGAEPLDVVRLTGALRLLVSGKELAVVGPDEQTLLARIAVRYWIATWWCSPRWLPNGADARLTTAPAWLLQLLADLRRGLDLNPLAFELPACLTDPGRLALTPMEADLELARRDDVWTQWSDSEADMPEYFNRIENGADDAS